MSEISSDLPFLVINGPTTTEVGVFSSSLKEGRASVELFALSDAIKE